MHLVIVDTAQIQSYIFGSNRLRENIGASHLVAQATESWAHEAVVKVACRHNVQSSGSLDNQLHIECAQLDAELVYSGGGNTVVLFREEGVARAFVRELSRQVLKEAPGLQLIIVSSAIDWEKDSLYQKVRATFKAIDEQKRSAPLSTPILGLGVTVMCQSTGLPAVGMTEPPAAEEEEGYPASAETFAKRDAVNTANDRLHRMLGAMLKDSYLFPSKLDYLGRSPGEQSYIAVVHADGDGIGRRIIDLSRQYSESAKNREYIQAIRRFSMAIQEASQAALRNTAKLLVDQVDGGEIHHPNPLLSPSLAVALRNDTSSHGLFLPFRPLVFGGDDVTFVCDGRIALSLTTAYLEEFERQTTALFSDGESGATACAGVAIVKAHYPFARAYALAEGLCRSAKQYRREYDIGSCLDWHFAKSGLIGGIMDIRRREYEVPSEGSLTLRPVALHAHAKASGRTWQVVRKGIKEFQESDQWQHRHNKVIALREALRGGRAAVSSFLLKYNEGKPLPNVEPSLSNWPRQGWQDKYCGYFDSIELVDSYIPLKGYDDHEAED